MPEFLPFPGVRFDTTNADIGDLTAPPYDVIGPAERARLVARDPHNIVQIDLPDEADGAGRYAQAASTFTEWISQGILVQDETPTFTIYRMDWTNPDGTTAHTLGVLGALRLSRPDEGEILPHEFTTPKAKSDRLDLLRATRTNLSAIWGLSLTSGLADLCKTTDVPDESWTDDDGIIHRLWKISDPELCAQISDAVGSTPIVVADGHHRYETSLAYRDERIEANDNPQGAEHVLAYIVELSPEELTVRPIHRLLSGRSFEAIKALLAESFELNDMGRISEDSDQSLITLGALALVDSHGNGISLTPKSGVFGDIDDLDSARLAAALGEQNDIAVRYQHGVGEILQALANGEATAGVLLRPATVEHIAQNAHSGKRMPPKTTFFFPKPRTGQVFRLTD